MLGACSESPVTNYRLRAQNYLDTPSSRKADASQKRTRDGLACNQMLQLSYSNKTDLYGAKKYVTSWEPGSVPSPGLCYPCYAPEPRGGQRGFTPEAEQRPGPELASSI